MNSDIPSVTLITCHYGDPWWVCNLIRQVHNLDFIRKIFIFDNSTNRNLMITARTTKNLTRIQLAKLINEHVSVIENLENGKVVNNINVLQKKDIKYYKT